MSECTHNCSSCGESCSSRNAEQQKESFRAELNKNSRIKKVIGVVSGKGGVGKSFVTSYLSVLMNRKGYNVGILDADITGPSIPAGFGLHEKAFATEEGLLPAQTNFNISVMSINLLLETEETPVIWRGPVIGGVVKQFWTDVMWGDIDYLFVDMPPGTGDVPLTVFQSLPVDGLIIVTSPQELVSMVVSKAVNMAKAMNIPVLGLIENYSYIECPDCGKKISIFGQSHVEETAAKFDLELLDRLPMDPAIAEAVDNGTIDLLSGKWLDNTAARIEQSCPVSKE